MKYRSEVTLTTWQMLRYGITDEQCGKVSCMSDDGVPFPEIADYIEANL